MPLEDFIEDGHGPNLRFCSAQTPSRTFCNSSVLKLRRQLRYPLLALPALRRACFDNTGLGMQFAERAQERFGKYKVEAVTFTAPVKEDLAYPVRASLEDRSCRLPDDPFVVSDFRAIRKETTAAGNIRFTAEANETGHADRFWAKALARHAAKASGVPVSCTII
jgi:phage FluMu gp28-like protein